MGGRGLVIWAHGVRDGPVLGRLLGEGAAEQGRRASIPSGDTASAADGWPGMDQGKRGTAESRHTGPSCAPLSEVILGLDCLIQRSWDLPPLHRVGCVHGGTRGTVCGVSAPGPVLAGRWQWRLRVTRTFQAGSVLRPQFGHWDGGGGGGCGKGESPATGVKVLPPPAHLLSP